MEEGRTGVHVVAAVIRRGADALLTWRDRNRITALVPNVENKPSAYEILVDVVHPGLIDTQARPLPPVMADLWAVRIPNLRLARPGNPDEVVAVVRFLASDAASSISAAGIGSHPCGPIVVDAPQ